jgi:acetoacetyl-CoA synthetase
VRFGSGEIYAVMEKFGSVVDDCLCVGQRRPQDDDERVLLFVKMRPGTRCDEAFKGNVRRAIREALSARHVPSFIFEVPEIPVS